MYRLYFDPRSAPVVFRQPQFARNQYKVALLGATRVGKTALFNRLCYDTFHLPDPAVMSMSVADECMIHSRIADKQSCEWADLNVEAGQAVIMCVFLNGCKCNNCVPFLLAVGYPFKHGYGTGNRCGLIAVSTDGSVTSSQTSSNGSSVGGGMLTSSTNGDNNELMARSMSEFEPTTTAEHMNLTLRDGTRLNVDIVDVHGMPRRRA
jgi:GTPase SAR1 family protein